MVFLDSCVHRFYDYLTKPLLQRQNQKKHLKFVKKHNKHYVAILQNGECIYADYIFKPLEWFCGKFFFKI